MPVEEYIAYVYLIQSSTTYNGRSCEGKYKMFVMSSEALLKIPNRFLQIN